VPPPRKVRWLLAAGAALVALGLAWSPWFPLINRIWTSSFCLVTSGCSALLLALFYHLIDVRGLRGRRRPGFLDTHVTRGFGGLVVALTGPGLAVLFCWFLHRQRIFLRV
jgi:hypothetical protein